MGGGKYGGLGNLGRGRGGAKFGGGEKISALGGDDQRQGRELTDAGRVTDNVADVAQVTQEPAFHAADHGVGFPTPERQGRDDGRIGAQQGARGFRRDAIAAGGDDVI